MLQHLMAETQKEQAGTVITPGEDEPILLTTQLDSSHTSQKESKASIYWVVKLREVTLHVYHR